MATVLTHAVMSLDGFIARPDDSVGPLFDWYENGDIELVGGGGSWTFHVSRTSADHVQPWWDSCRAIVMGRHLFDLTNGWNGVPSVGEHDFVVTHEAPTDWVPSEHLSAEDAPFTFVTTGIEDAIARAREFAGDGAVAVCAGDVGGQAVAAGLVDEVAIDVAPVLLGQGKRYFGDAVLPEGLLDDPVVVQGDRVLHLSYRVRR
ncbi:dihydrofolate reductase family protein [Nocardioides marmorisolisilvae]|uniref:Dihydrofolate reductase n=1 Tax=Nocardioides marmorisolisilvae TaxID=1542737 RepID=A0A3N0DVK0_9ACTN|nr:dihydrofolate reductase family protein [Nocardioides marmorisolisilvae]RNL79618.1 dihydrofolate reductase [Nocardioides marmorisolisilvae]